MDIDVHIERVKKGLSSKPWVVNVESPNIKRLSKGESRAIVKARLRFFDGSFLDIHERVDTNRCFPEYLTYSYQYIDKSGEQVFRYDAPHHPEVDTFPHHKHVGPEDDERIVASQCPSHSEIFREINQYLTQVM